jgi:hypothetical protein
MMTLRFQHHIHTNDIELDPDIAIEFYVRLNPTHPLLKFQVPSVLSNSSSSSSLMLRKNELECKVVFSNTQD